MLFYTADSFLCQYILEILKEGILTFRAQDNRLVPYYVRFNEAGKCYVIDYYHREPPPLPILEAGSINLAYYFSLI